MITVTPQQMIDAAWHRARIPRRSLDSWNSCIYASREDCPGCFIGVLADFDTAETWDSGDTSAGGLLEDGELVIECDWDDNRKILFAIRLQDIHDQQHPSEWCWRIYQLARKHGLTTPGSRR